MLEVINRVKLAEENAEELRKTARRTAAQMREDAARRGKELLDERTMQTVAQTARLQNEADARAGEYLARARQESGEACRVLKETAARNLDEAARFIVERVVNAL
jgi:F0F1-type ATP synthase membrane subunit b/b'